MQTYMFPSTYNQQSNNAANYQINNANQNFYRMRDYLEKSRFKKPNIGDYLAAGGGIGLICGLIGCFGVCISVGGGRSGSEWTAPSFLTFIGVPILAIVISLVIWGIVVSSYSGNNSSVNMRISQEQQRLNQFIYSVQRQTVINQQNYRASFEQNAQNMSVQLAESELAKEVIQWMTEGFSKTIDAADRRSHIEQISVPFQFKVFVDKITCNLGTYDFELKRCRNLTGPLEQTALARAIAAAIQFNITMKYPKDASGTDRIVNFEFSYTDTHPVATLTYAAPNGNYQAVRSW